ncbi:Ribonuclease H domain [Macleaya cordata]|uniref:Ribonuclease H domain n=1 Tax=Macleaya cordata TaxID=56857 RepID=A0A200QAV1_MACCD|nr:Ribonuclease H domain [Macleaya cordata]
MRRQADEVMINTDGSLDPSGAGYGAILKKCNGDVISAVTGSSNPKTSTVHKLQGIEAGLNLAINNNLTNVCVGTDSRVACSFSSNNGSNVPWQAIGLWRRIQRYVNMFESFRITHIFRDSNRAADVLARPSAEFVEFIPSPRSQRQCL